METVKRFDPFNDRLCRDIRNTLSEHFMDVLSDREMSSVKHAASELLEKDLYPYQTIYINRRLAGYREVLDALGRGAYQEPYEIAALIWDQHLFFEVHEYLEGFWLSAKGDERKRLQAMIRAAGTWVHLEQGKERAATRIAQKALPVIRDHRDYFRVFFDPDLLMEKLKALDPAPPRLYGTGWKREAGC